MRAPRAALDALVPSLILQPIVENALKHGIARRAGTGRVEVTARRARGRLRLEVRDDGPGFPEGWSLQSSAGVGLANTRARLQQTYGGSHRFAIRKARGGGAAVVMEFPLRVAPRCETGHTAEGRRGGR